MNNNDKIIAHVYETYDYNKFKKLDFNRKTGESRIKKLIESISVRSILNPIVVNKKYEVVDGQARFEARKKLGLPIHYVFDVNATIEDCRRMNRFNTPWSTYDFAVSYADSGKNDYHRLLAICDEQGINISLALRLAGKGKMAALDSIYDGALQFSSDNMENVRKCMTLAKELIKAAAYTKRIPQSFYVACLVCLQTSGFDSARMIRNMEKCRASFVLAASLEDVLKEFSRIYNKYGSSSGKLYFEDYMRNRGSNVREYFAPSYFDAYKSEQDLSSLRKGKK